MRYTKYNFPEKSTAIHHLLTWVSIAILLSILCIIALALYGLPLLIASKINLNGLSIICFFVYYSLVIFGTYKLINYTKSTKGEAIKQVTVNKEGVHFLKLNGKKDSILFTELSKSPSPFSSDIFTKSVGLGASSRTLLVIFHKGKEKRISFSNTDVIYTGATGNWRELRSHFIQGITLFRPDLNVSEFVYSEFFIHPETFEFGSKAFKKVYLIVIIFILIVLIGIDMFVKYQFGYSYILDYFPSLIK